MVIVLVIWLLVWLYANWIGYMVIWFGYKIIGLVICLLVWVHGSWLGYMLTGLVIWLLAC